MSENRMPGVVGFRSRLFYVAAFVRYLPKRGKKDAFVGWARQNGCRRRPERIHITVTSSDSGQADEQDSVLRLHTSNETEISHGRGWWQTQ